MSTAQIHIQVNNINSHLIAGQRQKDDQQREYIYDKKM